MASELTYMIRITIDNKYRDIVPYLEDVFAEKRLMEDIKDKVEQCVCNAINGRLDKNKDRIDKNKIFIQVFWDNHKNNIFGNNLQYLVYRMQMLFGLMRPLTEHK